MIIRVYICLHLLNSDLPDITKKHRRQMAPNTFKFIANKLVKKKFCARRRVIRLAKSQDLVDSPDDKRQIEEEKKWKKSCKIYTKKVQIIHDRFNVPSFEVLAVVIQRNIL